MKPTPGNAKGEFENNSTTDITAIGVAMSASPGGPFKRISEEPILKVSMETEKFDSYRVDDAALLFRMVYTGFTIRAEAGCMTKKDLFTRKWALPFQVHHRDRLSNTANPFCHKAMK